MVSTSSRKTPPPYAHGEDSIQTACELLYSHGNQGYIGDMLKILPMYYFKVHYTIL